MNQATQPQAAPVDHFLALSRELDEIGALLTPEAIRSANGDPTMRAASQVRQVIEHHRASVYQDRVNRLAADARRATAVRELIEGQGKTQAEADGIVAAYQGPANAKPVPDPATVQPDDDQAAKLQAGITRLKAIMAAPIEQPSLPPSGTSRIVPVRPAASYAPRAQSVEI